MATVSVAKKYSSIDPEVLRKAMKEIGEDDERRESTLKMIREWLKKQPHLNCPPGKYYYINRRLDFVTAYQLKCIIDSLLFGDPQMTSSFSCTLAVANIA